MEFGPITRALVRHRARLVLIVLEVALTLAIVANCVSLILNARSEMARLSGFDDENLIQVQSASFDAAYQDRVFARQAIFADSETLRHLPGVRYAASTGFLPWAGGGSSYEVKIHDNPREKVRSQAYRGDTHLFDTLGISLVAGRNFTEEEVVQRDDNATNLNVLVTQKLADLLFPEGNAVGRVLSDPDDTETYQIVGIVDPFYNPYGWPIHEYATFFPGPSGGPAGSSYLVRAEPGQREAVMRELEAALLARESGRNLTVRSIEEVRNQYNGSNRVLIAALTGVMVLLVFVTALGIIGLTSFSVSERTRQIGTRRALGATRGDIVRHFLAENWLLVTGGALLGLALAFALNIGLVGLVSGAKLHWPVALGGVLLLWAIGLASALGPALRGARVAPAIATRNV